MGEERDNAWFRTRWYGYLPVSKEGWMAGAVYVAIVASWFYYIDAGSHSAGNTLVGFAPGYLVLRISYLAVCRRKTGK